MKKSLVLLMAIMLAMGLLVSCGDSGGDDVDSDLQGTWLVIDALGGGEDIKMIIGEDTLEQYSVDTTDPFDVDHYNNTSAKGEMEADDGAFTFTQTHEWNEGTRAWDAAAGTFTGTYTLNGNQLTLVAEFDPVNPGNETVVLDRQ